MSDLIELASHSVRTTINILLKDRSTAQNIIFATTAYDNINFASPITKKIIVGNKIDLRPRVAKTQEEKAERTRKKAEVFTSAWICNLMNNQCDNEWFGRENVFNVGDNIHWQATKGKVEFPDNKSWKDYVCSTRLEIACGEAPYLVSRYDAVTGEVIPIDKRVGILDRKLRVINENVKTHRTWNHWAYRAFESTYGYEYQGDNLLVARINLLETFCEYTRYRWHVEPSETSLKRIARIISWNLWQMDGISRGVPQEEKTQSIDSGQQLLLFDVDEIRFEILRQLLPCKIRDWAKDNGKRQVLWERGMDMKFDFVIGNPPYQENDGGAQASAKPVYNLFVEAAKQIKTKKICMIIPARWYSGGKGLDKFRDEMLNDIHIKVIHDFPNTGDCFPNVNIRGGVCYFLWDKDYVNTNELVSVSTHLGNESTTVKRKLRALDSDIFFRYNDSLSILEKVMTSEKNFLSEYISARKPFGLSTDFIKTKDFHSSDKGLEKPVKCYGKNKKMGYIEYNCIPNHVEWIKKWKVFTPRANNIGIELNDDNLNSFTGKNEICTETYMVIGIDLNLTKNSANNLSVYLKTKFARFCHSLAKNSQDATSKTYRYVPLQDFTSSSDIDWSQSIADIDKQLYKKYNLSAEEIDFIESHVKEME